MTFEECFSFDNLLKMHMRCRLGKRHKKEVIIFELNLSENLLKLSKVGFEERALSLMYDFFGEEKGLPLGNQTSQWFALLYLDELDRFVKEKKGVKFYTRYMDDFILIHESKEFLNESKNEIAKLCEEKLKLKINSKSQVGRLSDGVDYLGFHHKLTESGKVVTTLSSRAKKTHAQESETVEIAQKRTICGR